MRARACGVHMLNWNRARVYLCFHVCLMEATFSALGRASGARSKRGADRVPDRPLNPPPGTLTAPPWEADPEGPEAEAPPPSPPLGPCTHVPCTHICPAAVKGPCSHEELAARPIDQLPLIRTLENLLELPLLLNPPTPHPNPHSECLTVTHTCTRTLRSNCTIRSFISSIIAVNKLLDEKENHLVLIFLRNPFV